jgi:hypothetical protein
MDWRTNPLRQNGKPGPNFANVQADAIPLRKHAASDGLFQTNLGLTPVALQGSETPS